MCTLAHQVGQWMSYLCKGVEDARVGGVAPSKLEADVEDAQKYATMISLMLPFI
jgi:hypothetical protein